MMAMPLDPLPVFAARLDAEGAAHDGHRLGKKEAVAGSHLAGSVDPCLERQSTLGNEHVDAVHRFRSIRCRVLEEWRVVRIVDEVEGHLACMDGI